MSESYKFVARTLFFAFVVIFCAFLMSENSEAEYTKYPIWSASNEGIADFDGETKYFQLNYSPGDKLSDISSDGKYMVTAEDSQSSYWQDGSYDDNGQQTRKGYSLLGAFYYNSSFPSDVFYECILGNNYYWENSKCKFKSVAISGDGGRIAAIVSERYYCRNEGDYDGDSVSNATGPCTGFYTDDQEENGWPSQQAYTGYRYKTKLVIFDRESGNLLAEHAFCYNDGYDRYTTAYAICESLYNDNNHFVEMSKEGNHVIVGLNNQLFGFTVSDANSGPDWSYSYSNPLYDAKISDNGNIVAATVGEFLRYYNTGTLAWQSHLFGEAYYMDMSGDGTKLSVATNYMMVYSFTSTSPNPIWEYAHYQSIYAITISSSGSHVLVSSTSGLLYFLQNSNTPLWVTENSYGSSISLSYNGMMIFANNYFINSINGNTIWQTMYGSQGFISDEGNFVYTSDNGIYYYTVDSQIFYPVAIAGQDTTKKTSQVVQFTGQGTDQDGEIVKFEWDFDGNGVYDWYNYANGLYTYFYNNEGVYVATLRVTDSDGLTSTDTVTITVAGVSTGELIDPKDDGEEENQLTYKEETATEENPDSIPVPSAKEEDEGFLPSLGIITSLAVLSIIGLIRRYK